MISLMESCARQMSCSLSMPLPGWGEGPQVIPMGNGRGFWGFSQLGGQEEAAAPWQTALHLCTPILTSGPLFQRGLGIS